MDLRDEGIPAGCEADLDATLTMMLMQHLFDRPAFQHNPSVDTEKNLYFGAHCTCATRMHGTHGDRQPYVFEAMPKQVGDVSQKSFSNPIKKSRSPSIWSTRNSRRMILYTGQDPAQPARCAHRRLPNEDADHHQRTR